MTDSVAPSAPQVATTRGRWWRAPLVSTLVSVLLLPVMRACAASRRWRPTPATSPVLGIPAGR
ncbi:hypothetical protein [Kitasatospora herbaricolor]|uniref:Uncharacterized protein n=1 Tax=Kitasatospora herbaricolor TaxID=68217 RepID=A0ABZ1W0I0_9ACTN|nr:hypothetical protein [Kitasatospora herbaricolor]